MKKKRSEVGHFILRNKHSSQAQDVFRAVRASIGEIRKKFTLQAINVRQKQALSMFIEEVHYLNGLMVILTVNSPR